MKIVLAVSGGIDSMVMLDMIYRADNYSSDDIIVAHFDHGIRENSATDAEFVKRVTARYGLEFALGTAKLGSNASEADARTARYDFLVGLARQHAATIYTAHHLDDLVESITINFLRGTGWRGLAVLDTPGVVRPFLMSEAINASEPWDKKAILKYAAKHHITFRQDPTNQEDKYLRNRIRQSLVDFPGSKKHQLYELWRGQKTLKHEIDGLISELLPMQGSPWQRSWFDNLDDKVALELLRAGTIAAGISAIRPQLIDFLNAIRTYASGKYFNLPNRLIRLEKDFFVL